MQSPTHRRTLAILACLVGLWVAAPVRAEATWEGIDTVAITNFPFRIDERLIAGMHVVSPGGMARVDGPEADWLDRVLRATERRLSAVLGIDVVRTNRQYGAFPPQADMVGELPHLLRGQAFRDGGYDAILDVHADITPERRIRRRGLGREPVARLELRVRLLARDGTILWQRRVEARHEASILRKHKAVSYGSRATRLRALETWELVALYERALEALER